MLGWQPPQKVCFVLHFTVRGMVLGYPKVLEDCISCIAIHTIKAGLGQFCPSTWFGAPLKLANVHSPKRRVPVPDKHLLIEGLEAVAAARSRKTYRAILEWIEYARRRSHNICPVEPIFYLLQNGCSWMLPRNECIPAPFGRF